jgi:hypothetical protein
MQNGMDMVRHDCGGEHANRWEIPKKRAPGSDGASAVQAEMGFAAYYNAQAAITVCRAKRDEIDARRRVVVFTQARTAAAAGMCWHPANRGRTRPRGVIEFAWTYPFIPAIRVVRKNTTG